jgi:hypothetical protein
MNLIVIINIILLQQNKIEKIKAISFVAMIFT